MEFLDEWLILIGVFSIAIVSPGPDFVMAIRNSVIHSRKAGLFTAIGFGMGVGVHVAYSIIGIAALISQSVMAFNIIKYIGAAYLIYIGIKSLRSKGFQKTIDTDDTLNTKKDMSALAALQSGFITNLFNPKATMFFLALFTQILEPNIPVTVKILFGATCMIMCTGWFSLVAIILTDKRIQSRFLGITKYIDRVCGGVLVALGVKLATSKIAS